MFLTKQSNSISSRSLWFADGLWWFCPHGSKKASEISSLMREARFDAEALARALRVGDRTFRRMVKESFDVPPGFWLRRERAVAIRHQLKEGLRIKEISSYYGFKNSSDFSEEFKRWYGITPSRFLAGVRRNSQIDSASAAS